MQSTKKLASAFRSLLALVEEEAAKNPSFAARLDEVTGSLPGGAAIRPSRRRPAGSTEIAPDVFAAHQEKGEEEFSYWLRSMNLRVLKAIVKANGFDPGKASLRWTEPDKFVTLIAEQTAARLRRGSAFLTSRRTRSESD